MEWWGILFVTESLSYLLMNSPPPVWSKCLEYTAEGKDLEIKGNTIIQQSVLHVDLSRKSIQIEHPEESVYRKYLGGRGIGLYYTMKEIDPQCDPLGADNSLVFASGLLNGIPGPGIPKYSVLTKSPLTGCIGESEAGGFWGPTLRLCAFDAIVVKGKAERPIFLAVTDGEVRIEDAAELWELDTKAFQEKVQEKYEKARVLQIGPGGTRKVLFANITNDLSFFNGRNGLGAVMGSKNLRAIVLKPLRRSLDVPDIESIRAVARSAAQMVKENALGKALNELGTAGGIVAVNSAGSLPTNNWTRSVFEGAEKIGGQVLRDKYLKKRHGCFACPVRCKRIVEINQDNIKVDPDFGGPEYESIATLGSMCGVSDLPVICKANELCNRYGLDTMSCGSTIAFAMQCFEERLISEKEVGYDLSFGNGESLLRMIEDIAYRKGFGDVLALGSYRAAEKIGDKACQYVHHVRKQELPMHDGRVKTGLALQYALSPRGADHWVAQHDPFFTEEDSPGIKHLAGLGIQSPVPIVGLGPKKVRFFYYTNIICSAYDILGVCTLAAVARSIVTLDQILDLARAATGWNLTWYEIMKCGERTNTLARIFNTKADGGTKEDKLASIFMRNIAGGPKDGTGAIDQEMFEEALHRYYEMAGWTDQGIPTSGKVQELDINDCT